jgi:hypothetical protein
VTPVNIRVNSKIISEISDVIDDELLPKRASSCPLSRRSAREKLILMECFRYATINIGRERARVATQQPILAQCHPIVCDHEIDIGCCNLESLAAIECHVALFIIFQFTLDFFFLN